MAGSEAADDAAAVLEQQQSEQELELPDPSVGDVPLFSTGHGSYGQRGREAPERSSSGGEVRALEDLYTQYPEFGKGDWKLHIERTAPRSFRGHQTAGFLGECYEKLSTAEFKERFGGASYVVKVLKPTSAGANATKSDYQTVKQFRFRVPGDPTLEGIPQRDEDDMVQKFDPRMMVGGVPEKVQIANLQLQAKREEQERADRLRMEEKMEQQRAAAATIPPQHMSILQESTKRMFDDTRAQVDAQTSFWQQEVERIRSENAALLAETRRQAKELVEAKRESSDTFRVQESQALRDAKERYEERIRESEKGHETRNREQRERFDEERRRLTEENRDRIERVENDHRKQLDEINRRHDEERRQADSRSTEERDRIRDDYRDRLDRVERDKEHRIEQLQQTHRERIEDLTRSTQREIESLRDQTRREVDSTRTVERSQAKLAEHSAKTQVTVMEGELNRLREDERHYRDRVRDAEGKLHKEPLAALTEAKQMAMEFGGLVESSSLPGEGGWMDKMAPFAKPLSETINNIIDKAGSVRAANQAAAGQHVSSAPQQHPQLPAPQPRYRSAPLNTGPQIPSGGGVWRPQQSNYQSPPFGGMTMPTGSSVPFSAPMDNVPSPIQPGGETAGGVPFGGVSASDDDAGSSAEAFAATPGPTGEPNPAATVGTPTAALNEFCNQLETVVAGRLLSPPAFAQQVIERIGVQQTGLLLQQFSPAVVIQHAAGLGGSGALQTRDGQRYVGALWQVATQLVGAQMQSPAGTGTQQPAAPTGGTSTESSPLQPTVPTGGTTRGIAMQQPGASEPGSQAEDPPAPSTATEPTDEPGEPPLVG